MDTKFLKILFIFLLLFLSNNKIVFSEIIKDIRVIGNDRISKETITMFSTAKINDDVDTDKLNQFLKNLYITNYFENVCFCLQSYF